MAASSTRNSTSVNGGSSRSTTPLKKNEPPHRTESRPSSDQSRASIRPSLTVIAQEPGESRNQLDRTHAAVHPISDDYFGCDTISIILPSSSSGAFAFALS